MNNIVCVSSASASCSRDPETQEIMRDKLGGILALCDQTVGLSDILMDKLFGGSNDNADVGAGANANVKPVTCVNLDIETIRNRLVETCNNLNYLNQNI